MQVVRLFETDASHDSDLSEFIRKIAEHLMADEGSQVLKQAFVPVLSYVHEDFKKANIVTFPRTHFMLLSVFTNHPDLAQVKSSIENTFALVPIKKCFFMFLY